MDTTVTQTSAERMDIATHWSAIRGAVANVLRRAGLTQQADVDDYTSAATIHCMEYSLPRYDASRGLDVRKYLMICAERHAGKSLAKRCNQPRLHVACSDSNSDFDTGDSVDFVPCDVDPTPAKHVPNAPDATAAPSAKPDAERRLSAHDAQGTAFAALMARVAASNLADAEHGLTDAERSFLATIRHSESWGEVAERTGLSPATVTRRWRALAERLRTLLKVG